MKQNTKLVIHTAMLCLGGSLLLAVTASADINPAPSMQRLGKITGSTVNDTAGQAIGQIQDLVADTRSGNLDFAVISLNDNRGLYTAVPWQLLRQTAPNTYTFTGDRTKLRSAETFTNDRWPDFSQPDYGQRLYTYYGVTWPANTARGGYVPVPQGVESGRGYYYDENPQNTKPWVRPQPDGRETFPRMIHPNQP